MTLFQSKDHFENKFNSFAQDFTNKPDAYAGTIATAAKAGVRSTRLLVQGDDPDGRGVRHYGDLQLLVDVRRRRARQASTMKTARNMALGGVIPLILVAICTAVFFHTFGG